MIRGVCLARLIVTVVLPLVAPYVAFGHERQNDVLGIEQLRLLARERQLRVGSLWVASDVFQDPSSFSADGHIAHMFRSVLVDAATGRFSMDSSMEIEGAERDFGTQNATLTFDGEVQGAFLPDQMIGVVQEGTNVDGLRESGLWGVMMLGEPQPGGMGLDDASLESLLARGAVRDQLELVGDARCHVVDAFHEGVRYATVWLDVERGLLPMKRVGWGWDGAVSSAVTVDSVMFLEDEHVWLPRSWQTEFRARGETLRTQTVVEPEWVEINPPVGDEDFRPQFPPGTIVTDQISGQAYRIADSGEIGEILYERINGEWVSVGPPVIPTESAPESGSSPPLSIIESLADVVELARRSPAPKRPQRTERDAGPEAAPTSPTVGPGQATADSKRPTQSRPAATAPVDTGVLDAPRERAPTQPLAPGVADPEGAHTSGSAWPWVVGATAVVAVLGIGYSVWRRNPPCRFGERAKLFSMNTRICWLLIAALLIAAFAVWRICEYVPAAGSGQYVSQSARPLEPGVPLTIDDYALTNDEVIRHIPTPDPEARRRLLTQLGLPRIHDCGSVVSLTVLWDGVPSFHSMQVGTGIFPRRLSHVLINSLDVPLYRLEGIDVAREIGLPGDWVVRAGADLDDCMSYLEGAVQRSGYSEFRITPRVRKCSGHEMHGAARAPQSPVQIFSPHPDVPPVLARTGTLRQFGQELSMAIRRPVSVRAEPQDLELAWQDNSSAYIDLGPEISDEMVSTLLHEVSAAVGVSFTDFEDQTTVWCLEWDK